MLALSTHAGLSGASYASVWKRMPDMLNARSAMGCAALGGCVYAIGGAGPPVAAVLGGAGSGGGGSGGGTHRSVEMFDLGREEWNLLSSELTYERKYTAVSLKCAPTTDEGSTILTGCWAHHLAKHLEDGGQCTRPLASDAPLLAVSITCPSG